MTSATRTWASKLLILGRVVAECHPLLSAVDVQLNKKQSFETDIVVLYTFVLSNKLHALGVNLQIYMFLREPYHFLGGMKGKL